MTPRRNPAAVALGRRGGKAHTAAQTAARRRNLAGSRPPAHLLSLARTLTQFYVYARATKRALAQHPPTLARDSLSQWLDLLPDRRALLHDDDAQ